MSDEDRSPAQDAFIMGDLLARQGDVESARGAFQSEIAMGDPRVVAAGRLPPGRAAVGSA